LKGETVRDPASLTGARMAQKPTAVRRATVDPPWARTAADRYRDRVPRPLPDHPAVVAVFAEALNKGVGLYFAAITDPEALSAIRLTC
jgi:sulfate transport system permease protein